MKLTQKKVNKLFLKAIEDGDLNTVKYLLNDSQIKADLYVKNEVEDPLYALLVSVIYNRLDILQYFLEGTELKKYTKIKGAKEFYKKNIGDTVFMMYEYAGQTGNLELINYLNEKLYWENKFDLFANAALDNHKNVLEYIVKNNWLSQVDKTRINEDKNRAIEFAIKSNVKDSFYFLIDYYKKNNPQLLNQPIFIKHCLAKSIDSINQNSQDFEMFNMFYNHRVVQNNQDDLLREKTFQKIASRKNVELFKISINKIKDLTLKKKLVLDCSYYAIEDHGRLSDFPLYQYMLDTYSSYFNKQDKENIFINLVYAKERSRFHDLMCYGFLTKGIDVNHILRETVYHIRVEDTYEYIKDILQSDLNKKINIHFEDNYFFKEIKKELESEQITELLKIVLTQCKNVNLKKITPIFEDDNLVKQFLDKWQLNEKLKLNLPEKNIKTKTHKI